MRRQRARIHRMPKTASIGKTVGVVELQTLALRLPPVGFQLEKGGVRAAFINAVVAATNRANELSRLG